MKRPGDIIILISDFSLWSKGPTNDISPRLSGEILLNCKRGDFGIILATLNPKMAHNHKRALLVLMNNSIGWIWDIWVK